MKRSLDKEPTYGAPDNAFARKLPSNATLSNSEVSPNSQISYPHENKILCKRIDNSAYNVPLKGDPLANQKFVPLAFPLENLKKRAAQASSSTEEASSKGVHKLTQSMPQSIMHSRPETRPQSMPASHNTSLTFNGNEQNLHDNRGYREQRATHYERQFVQDAYKASLGHSAGLMNRLLSNEDREREHGKSKSRKKSAKKLSVSDKTTKPPRQVTDTTKVKKEIVERQPYVESYLHRPVSVKDFTLKVKEKVKDEIKEEIKSGKSSKAASPTKFDHIQKKEKRKQKKKEQHGSKSEVPAGFDDMVKRGAHEYLENLKAKKQISELEKRLQEEKRMALEEGNRMIRLANMQRFNPGATGMKPQPKLAWGADQRKLKEKRGHERHGSMGHPRSKSKMGDKERRKMLGLDHLDEERISQLQRKAHKEQTQREKSQEQGKGKKSLLNSEEKIRVQDYMQQKRARMELEQYYRDSAGLEDMERKKKNLEKLFGAIRQTRERERENKKGKGKKKLKLKKKKIRSPRKGSPEAGAGGNKEDENFRMLYDEYKRMKKYSREDEANPLTNQQLKNRNQNVREALLEQERRKQKRREEDRQKYEEMYEKYQYDVNTAQFGGHAAATTGAGGDNRSSKRSSPEKKGEKVSSGDREGRALFDNQKNEAQKAIIEIETDNFTETNDLNSERRKMEEKYGKKAVDAGGYSDRVYDTEGNLPEESAREIIEAAAIFIQKNYRGYRTRKLLSMYFDQLYLEELNDAAAGQEDEYDEFEERGDEKEYGEYEDEKERYQYGNRVDVRKEKSYEVQEDHGDEYEYDYRRDRGREEGEDEEEDEEFKYNEEAMKRFVEQNAGKTGQKGGAAEYVDVSEPTEESESFENKMKYLKKSVQDQLGEKKRVEEVQEREIEVQEEEEEDVEPQQEEVVEESEEFGNIRIMRRAKSDGELLAEHPYGLNYDEMEDSDQVSLHDDEPVLLNGDYQRQMKMGQGYLKGVSLREGKLTFESEERGEEEEEREIQEGISRELEEYLHEQAGHLGEESYSEKQRSVHRETGMNLNLPSKPLGGSQDVVPKIKEVNKVEESKSKTDPKKKVVEGNSGTREGKDNSKSLIASEEEDKKVTGGKGQLDISDRSDKRKLPSSVSGDLRAQLIQELNIPEQKKDNKIEQQQQAAGQEPVNKKVKEVEEKKEVVSSVEVKPTLLQSTELTSLPTGTQVSTTQNMDKVILQKTFELTAHYQNELARLREEQAKQWNEVINQLGMLQNQGEGEMSHNLKSFVENLAKQSEINKKMLLETKESDQIIKVPGLSERSPASGVDNLLKGNQSGTPKRVSDFNQGSVKKVGGLSPYDEKFPSRKKKPFDFSKKPNLEIDINNTTNEEGNEAAAGLGLDLSQMRMTLGSEQLIREQSARTLSQSLNTPTELEFIDLQTPENMEGIVSIFERDPFKEFAQKKFKELMTQENLQKIIEVREQALEMRHKTQMDSMKRMLENQKFSPRTFHNKAIELEKWVSKERANIQRSKRNIEKGWTSTADSLKRTQRDLQFLKKVAGVPGGEGRHSTLSDLSMKQSFVEEEHLDKSEQGEGATEKVVRTPGHKQGSVGKSPSGSASASKSIKIIDQFEIKDGCSTEHKREVTEESKGREGEATGPRNYVRETEEDKLISQRSSAAAHPDIRTPEGTDKKGEPQRDTTPQSFSYRDSSRLDGASSSKYSEGRVVTEGDIVTEPGLVGTMDRVITQGEIRSTQSLPAPEKPLNQDDIFLVGMSKSAVVEGQHHENRFGSSSNLSSKPDQELRALIQEQAEALNASAEAKHREAEQGDKEPEKASNEKQKEEMSIQKKADLVSEAVFKSLMEEVGKELGGAEKEHIGEKVKEMENSAGEGALHNLIENNRLFNQTSNEKHPGFHANISMPPAGVVQAHGVAADTHHKGLEVEIEEDLTDEDELLRQEIEKEEHLIIGHHLMAQKGQNLEVVPGSTEQDQVHPTEPNTDIFKILSIRTDLKAVENYLNILLKEIKGDYLEDFLGNINVPIGLSVREKMSNMHAYELAGSESSLETTGGLQQAILSIELYLQVEKNLMDENPTKNEVSVELEHIHNKMIFDCLNEILDSYRPYGMTGEPYPWKLSIRSGEPIPITEKNMDRILNQAKKKVMEWAGYICGYYGDNDDFIQDRTQSFAEEYLAQAKEEKLSKMLAAEVHEADDKWLTYDDEEAEVQLELSDLVFDKLVTEAAEFILQVTQRKGIKAKLFEKPKVEERKRKGSL